jgi:hypothetical protein
MEEMKYCTVKYCTNKIVETIECKDLRSNSVVLTPICNGCLVKIQEKPYETLSLKKGGWIGKC